MTKREVSDRKFRLQSRLEVLKENETVKYYLLWKNLPPEKQAMLEIKWSQYYKDCLLTDSYDRYQTVKEAWRKGDFEKVKRFASMSREDLDRSRDPVKPSSYDPQGFIYDHHCQDYDKAMEELNILNKVTSYERAEEIFA